MTPVNQTSFIVFPLFSRILFFLIISAATQLAGCRSGRLPQPNCGRGKRNKPKVAMAVDTRVLIIAMIFVTVIESVDPHVGDKVTFLSHLFVHV